MYSASPSMERRVRVSCRDHRMPALLLALAIVDREGRLAGRSSWAARRKSEGVGKKHWCSQSIFQEPAGSSLSGLIAQKPGPRTEFLAGRPQGNESYREGVRKQVKRCYL